MDWGKAKTVLIAALLVTNLIIGSFWQKSQSDGAAREAAAAKDAVSYAESLGIRFNTKLPEKSERLPVLFVEYGEGEISGELSFQGLPLIIKGDGEKPSDIKPGRAKGKTEKASAALYKLIAELQYAVCDFEGEETMLKEGRPESSLEGISVEEAELVYFLDREAFRGEALEDTAFPAWHFKTSVGDFYIYALSERS